MAGRVALLAPLLIVAGCSALPMSPQPQPGSFAAVYHRGQGVATGYRDHDRDGVRDYRDQCLCSAPGQAVDGNGCGEILRSAGGGTPFWLQLPSVYFASGAHEVEDPSRLEPSARQLQALGKHAALRIVGYTDSRGSAGMNLNLAWQRAQGVADVLAGYGLDPRRMQVQAAAAVEPAAGNDDSAGWARNRRVDILVYRKPVSSGDPVSTTLD